MTDLDRSLLGCSKCRFSQRGCKRCKDPAFQSRKRDSSTQSRNCGPAKRQKRKGSNPAVETALQATQRSENPYGIAATEPTKVSETGTINGQAAQSIPAVSSGAVQPTLQPQRQVKAPPPDSSTTLAHQQDAPVGLSAEEQQPRQEPQAADNDADMGIQSSQVAPADPQPNASPLAAQHASASCQGLKAAAPDASAARTYTGQAQNFLDASRMPSDAAAAVAAAAAEQSPATSTQVAAAATAASDQAQPAAPSTATLADQSVATPSQSTCQPDASVGLPSQTTASESRPSFLSMLQSKMDKRRQQRQESASAASASESSMSSVHAPGGSSAEKPAASVDSGRQASQAVKSPRTKARQGRRRSAKKPLTARPFLLPGVDPRQALWHPPASPYGLIEEYLYQDPWKLLVACMLLNVTSGLQVRKVIWKLFEIWPTAEVAADAHDDTLVIVEKLIQPLGLFRKRTIAIKRFSQEYLGVEWLDPIELHGIGQYASDAYFIFCRGNWRDVQPSDKDLLRYQQWLHSTGGEGTGLERDVLPAVGCP